MNLDDLRKPLTIEDIDFRVQSINKGGYAIILAYKDARVDMQRLDDVVGALNWKREHSRENHNCIVSIWNEKVGHWVSKEDTGTESNAEAQKGLASDSFKRACFNWGIGRELYDYPLIRVKLNENEYDISCPKVKATWNLRIREWIWCSQFDDSGKMTYLAAKYQNKLRYECGQFSKGRAIQGTEVRVIAPEVKSYTPDQKHHFDCLINNNDASGIFALMSSIEPSVWVSLNSSFEKGSIGKMQKIVRGLIDNGRDVFSNCMGGIENALHDNDDVACIELMSELSQQEQALLYERLHDEYSTALRRIMKAAQ